MAVCEDPLPVSVETEPTLTVTEASTVEMKETAKK